MKKILLAVLALFFSLLFTGKAYAQQSYFLVPGVNCGIAGDIKTSRCCSPTKFTMFRAPDLGAPFTVMTNLVNGAISNVLKGVADPLTTMQQQMLVPCQIGVQSIADASSINCRCQLTASPTPGPIKALQSFCDNQSSASDKSGCSSCINGGGAWTSLGCVQGTISEFIGKTIFGWGIGLAGGFSLLCIIFAAFTMQSSQGNPEKLKKAQEMITSCIMGLMLIIFSIFILRLIGVNILRIPGFN